MDLDSEKTLVSEQPVLTRTEELSALDFLVRV
jgi:hypothetical protein